MKPAGDKASEHDVEPEETGPARALTLHLLRMLDTRMDAFGLAVRSEINAVTSRAQLKLLAVAALVVAAWAAIVLIAVALPPHLRVPVLSVVVGVFLVAALWAFLAARRERVPGEIGSMRWFLDGLKLDLEVLSRTLEGNRAHGAAPPPPESEPPPAQENVPGDTPGPTTESRRPASDLAA
jgi:hypothetical protein